MSDTNPPETNAADQAISESWDALPDPIEQSISSSASFLRKVLDQQSYGPKEAPTAAQIAATPGDPTSNAAMVKRVALLFGAAQAGICIPEREWLKPQSLIEDMEFTEESIRAIVIAVAMDSNAFRNAPSKSVSRASTMGYMQMALVSGAVAEFIRCLGYQAVAHGNSGAVSAPLAEKAGLGEVGRHCMLITQDRGACLRLCKVFTDMPLAPDRPAALGVREFCASCNQCINACPADAIIQVDEPMRIYEGLVLDTHWRVDGGKCREQWNRVGSSCGICIAKCPYTWPV